MSEGRIKVGFDDPQHGWVGFSIERGEDRFAESFSHTPYDSFTELAGALSQIAKGDGAAVARWNAEPVECEFQFERSGGTVELRIITRHRRRTKVVFRSIGDVKTICVPFWRSLRNLHGRFSAEKWQWPFPVEAVARLTRALGRQ